MYFKSAKTMLLSTQKQGISKKKYHFLQYFCFWYAFLMFLRNKNGFLVVRNSYFFTYSKCIENANVSVKR